MTTNINGTPINSSFANALTTVTPTLNAVRSTGAVVPGGSFVDKTLTITPASPDTAASELDGAQFLLGNKALGTLSISGSTTPSGTITGINYTYDGDTGVLSLSGTASITNYQALMRNVIYTPLNGASLTQQTVDITLGRPVFNFSNGHYYEFIADSAPTWDAAKTAAEARNFFGLQGYLGTLTSAAEDAFISQRTAGQAGWIGASDEGGEGIWSWRTGPEAGAIFFGAGAVPGSYVNWLPGEPNNTGGNENYGQFSFDGQFGPETGNGGKWTDEPNSGDNVGGYLVEYGGFATDVDLSKTRARVQMAGTPDLLIRNPTSGDTKVVNLSGTNGTVVNSELNTTLNGVAIKPGAEWQIIGTYDGDGNGTRDLTWYNTTTSETAIWLMGGVNGNEIQSAVYANLTGTAGAAGFRPGLEWKATFVSNIVPGGGAEIFWFNNTTGQSAIWDIDYKTGKIGGGTAFVTFNGATLNLGNNSGWNPLGAGDFDGDAGTREVIWYNSRTTDVAMWGLNGAAISTDTARTKIIFAPGGGWSIEGFGDVDKDGKDDILFQNGTTLGVWFMNGTTLESGAVATLGASQLVRGLADIGNNGTVDLVTRNKAADTVSVYGVTVTKATTGLGRTIALAAPIVVTKTNATYNTGSSNYDIEDVADYGGVGLVNSAT